MKIAILLALLSASVTVAAREVVCTPPGNSRFPCSPPATYRSSSAATPGPMDAPVRFGGEVVIQGRVFWKWIKTGPATRECNARELAERGGSYAYICSAKVGDVLYITSAFRVE
jgi:hypothetical protein